MSTTRRRDPERTTADIMAAAEREFAEHGFAGARIDQIATSAGVNKSLIFQRFGDKTGLYTGVLEQVAARSARYRDHLGPVLDPTTPEDFRETLTALVEASIDFLSAEPHAARMLLWEEASGWATLGAPQLGETPCEGQIETLFTRAAERGWVRPGLATATQFSLALQVPFAAIALGADLGAPGVRGFLIDFVVGGLTAPADSTPTA